MSGITHNKLHIVCEMVSLQNIKVFSCSALYQFIKTNPDKNYEIGQFQNYSNQTLHDEKQNLQKNYVFMKSPEV